MKVSDLKEYMEIHFPQRYAINEFNTSSPDNCVAVILGSSGTNTRTLKNLTFQFLVRNEDPEEAERIAHEIYNHFNNKSDYMVGTEMIVLSKGQQSIPLYTGKDANDRTIYSINVDVIVDK